MKNFIQEGRVLDLVAPSGGVTAGVGVKIGALFVVAAVTAAEAATFAGDRLGVFELAATAHESAQAMAVGDTAYWDDSTKKVTKTATGNQRIGVITETKATTAAVARVVLTPSAGVAGTTIADLSLAAVTGVDGTGSNAASKADVDTRFASIVTKVNAMLAAMEAAGTVVA